MARKKNPRTALGIKWGEGHIHRRGDKWQARWDEPQPDGTTRSRARTFASEDDAVEHLRQVAREKRERRYVARDHMTIDMMLAEYLERGALRWSSNTLATYTNTVATHVAGPLGKYNVHDLTGRDVQLWVDRLTRDGVSASIIENALHIVSGAYREALRFGVVSSNPATGVKAPPRPRTQMLTWSAVEARKVLADPDATSMLRALYALDLAIGLRPGELRGLQWPDIDLDRGVVHIRRSMTRDEGFRAIMGDDTKTIGSRRSVAIPASVVTALRAHREDQTERRSSARLWDVSSGDVVFDNGHGRFISQQSWKRAHDAMCERLDITRIRLHDIRHTAATLMLERNVHPKVVAEILGHSSVTMTLDRYSHVSESLQRTAIDAVDAHLRSTTTRTAERRKRAIPRRNPRRRSRIRATSRKIRP